jgi:hypothetical protein
MMRALLAAAFFMLAVPAQAAVIDFEAEHGAHDRFPRSFVEDGVRVSYDSGIFGFNLIDDPAAHLGMCSPGCTSNGTTALYAFNDSSITFDLENGGLFSFTALDIAQTWLDSDRPLDVTLIGAGAAGIVTRTISLGAQQAESFSSLSFSDFANLSSLTIRGGSEFAIDNVAISTPAVPEPATWALMIAGFGIVGGALRRRPLQPRLA